MANDDKVTQISGNAGSDLDDKVYQSNGTNVLKISVAVTMSYGENGVTRWVNCSIWQDKQPDLFAWAQGNVGKGTPLAVEGFLKMDRQYEGKTQYDLRVTRIGLVAWAKRANSGQQQTSKPQAQPAAETVGAEW